MGYQKKAIAGFGWRQFFYIVNNLIAVGRIMILARLLTPYDFGLFSITAISLGLSEAFTQTGINITILQSKKKINFFLDTAWVIAIFRGLIIAILVALFALVLPHFYHETKLVNLIILASLIPLIKGFINPMVVSLQKDLNFFKDTIFNLTRTISEAILVIVFALYLRDATAFIFAMIGSASIEVCLSFLIFKLKPRFKFSKERAAVIFHNAKSLSPMAFLDYLHENLDNLIVGKILGTNPLGIYQNAYALSHKANYQITQASNHSLLPIFSRIETDKIRLRRAFFKSFVFIGGLISVTSAILFLWPSFIVNLILGAKWHSAIQILPILTLAGLLQGFAMLFYSLFLAKAKFKPINFHLVSNVLLLVIFIWWGSSQAGLVGASWGVVASRVVSLPILVCYAYQVLK